MKILLIAPIHNYSAFSRQNSESPFVEGQGQQSWYRALMSLGHEVKVFRYTDTLVVPESFQQHISEFFLMHVPHMYFRFRKLHDMLAPIDLVWKKKNNRIRSLVSSYDPDLIIVSGGTAFLSTKVFLSIKKDCRIPTVYFSGIHPLNATSSRERSWVVKCTDYVVTNDVGYAELWKNLGIEKVITLPISAFDNLSRASRSYRPSASRMTEGYNQSDVCFVGTLTRDRIKILERLKKYHLKIWGPIAPGAKLSSELKKFYYGKAYHDDLYPIYRSTKIALNFQPKDMASGGNMRLFEIPGDGAFQLTDKINTEWFVEGKEVVVFKNDKDLIKKIDYFLKNGDERKKIAHAGQVRTLKDHTYKKRFRKLFSIIKTKE